MRGMVAAGLVLSLLMAGCATKDDGSTTSGAPVAGVLGTASSTNSTPEGQGTAGAAAMNHAPTGSIVANRTQGKAPFKVTFRLNGTDTDGDRLNLTVDFDGNGTLDLRRSNVTFPATANFTYAKPGLYNVTYTLTDGKNSTVYKAKVNVTGGATGPPITISGTVKSPCTACYFGSDTTNCVGFNAGVNSADCYWSALTPAAAGRAFVVSAADDPGLEFFDKCSSSGKSLGYQDETADTEVGVVPAGAGCVVLYAFVSPQTTLTMVIT